ncbi:unnamed protein product [Eruca vesicaria subsp. sativa]|uniref:Uncharacterized protein n=1 Tax=Eruca vesicaria subsp. sativa TaxID=29727 RepID=A0ABC8KMK8_ERUVS|nr:unnamed protein product [Eruca vesicaria subsp. sativa]
MMMEKRKMVMCGVLSLLGLLSAVTAFAAEATRVKKSQVTVTKVDSVARCSYNRSPAYNLSFASAIFLMMAQIIASVGSGCFCCRKGPSPTRTKWILALVSFIVSWFTFVLAFLVLLTGASLNDEHFEETTNATSYFCYVVRPGVFCIGALISLFTVGLGIVYYLCLNSVKQNVSAATTTTPVNQGIAMGQAQIPQRVEDPVFVHEDTYMRRQFT